MDRKIIFALLAVLIAAGYWYFYMRKGTQPAAEEPASSGDLTVYGTPECGWTKKQLKYLDDKGMKYNFVNCKEGKCPSDVTGYPTLIYNGQRINGYNEL